MAFRTLADPPGNQRPAGHCYLGTERQAGVGALPALINQAPPENIKDFPVSPEVFLRLLPVGGPELELDLLALACRQSLSETRAYGAAGYPRLVPCLNRLGLRLATWSTELDPSLVHWAHVRQAFLLLLQYVENQESNPTWAVELNNLAKTWQSLPALRSARPGDSLARASDSAAAGSRSHGLLHFQLKISLALVKIQQGLLALAPALADQD